MKKTKYKKVKFDMSKLKIVQFARAIGKNTSEFTQFDMLDFLKFLKTGSIPPKPKAVASFTPIGSNKIRLNWR